jgi:hypothetical protein
LISSAAAADARSALILVSQTLFASTLHAMCPQQYSVPAVWSLVEAAGSKVLAALVTLKKEVRNLASADDFVSSTGVVLDGWSDVTLRARARLDTPVKSLASGEAARQSNAEVCV